MRGSGSTRDTLRALVENFADPAVGAVSGELVLTTSDRTAAAGRGSAFYWRYEKFIRSTEGRADSTIGATGAIYAIRRELFEPIPDDTILDDVLIPLRIVRKGYRVLFEPRARAYDSASATAQHEFVRKARTIAGTFQLFSRELWLFNPRRNRLWFETMSHKALRLALPVLHATLLVASAALAPTASGSTRRRSPARWRSTPPRSSAIPRAATPAARSSSRCPAPSAFSAGRRSSGSCASSPIVSRSHGNGSPRPASRPPKLRKPQDFPGTPRIPIMTVAPAYHRTAAPSAPSH